MRRRNNLLFFASGILFAVGILYTYKNPGQNLQKPPRQAVLSEVDLSLSIGGAAPVAYTLFGYTSALATVKLEGIGVNEETHARSDGSYEFKNFYAPRNSNEFCLTPIDTEQLMGTPLCIVAPQDVQGKRFGPYLLSPTISVATGNPKIGQSDAVSGKTIPGTSVTVNVFQEPDRQILTFAHPVYATSNSKIIATANADGSFTAKVTSDQSGKVRVFAQSVFKTQKTPKSNTLTLTIFGVWFMLLTLLISFLRNFVNWNVIILFQIILLAFILYQRSRMHQVYQKKRRALAIRKENLPMIEPERELITLN